MAPQSHPGSILSPHCSWQVHMLADQLWERDLGSRKDGIVWPGSSEEPPPDPSAAGAAQAPLTLPLDKWRRVSCMAGAIGMFQLFVSAFTPWL